MKITKVDEVPKGNNTKYPEIREALGNMKPGEIVLVEDETFNPVKLYSIVHNQLRLLNDRIGKPVYKIKRRSNKIYVQREHEQNVEIDKLALKMSNG